MPQVRYQSAYPLSMAGEIRPGASKKTTQAAFQQESQQKEADLVSPSLGCAVGTHDGKTHLGEGQGTGSSGCKGLHGIPGDCREDDAGGPPQMSDLQGKGRGPRPDEPSPPS